MAFLGKKKENKSVLAIDVGTSSVNCFLVLPENGEKPEVKVSTYSRIRLSEDSDFRNIWRHIKKALTEGILNIKKKNSSVDSIFVVFSSPWYFSETRLVRMERPEAFVVSKEILDDLISEEMGLFLRSSQEKLSLTSDKLVILENEIMRAILNEYPVKDPLSKKTKKLFLSLYLSLAKKDILEELRELLENYFGKVPVKVNSSAMILFRTIGDMMSPEDGFILVDIGGEITEVALVRRGVLEGMETFPAGGHLILRRIASSLKIDMEEAFSLLRSHTAGALKDGAEKKLSRPLEDASMEWYRFLSKILAKIGAESPLPQNLIFLGGASGIEELKAKLVSDELSNFTILGKPFSVINMLPENLSGRLNFPGVGSKDFQMTLPLLLVLAASNYAKQ